MIAQRPTDNGDEYSYTLHMSGMATTLPTDGDDETIAELHRAVKDVTGKEVEKPPKRGIGFVLG